MSSNIFKPSRWSRNMLSRHTREQLRGVCRKFGFSGYGKLGKGALVSFLMNARKGL